MALQGTLTDIKRELGFVARAAGWRRLIRVSLVMGMVCSLFVPVISQIVAERQYVLDGRTTSLIGKANSSLAAKFSYDAQKQQWVFNKDGVPKDEKLGPGQMPPEQLLKAQLGGTDKDTQNLYSVTLPADAKKGITYYDSNTKLSFSLLTEFRLSEGQAREGRLIYPFADGGKVIYTAKGNGMEEDIVLSHNIGDALQFNYKLNLPDDLEARPLDDGAIGIYSADPVLFGNISYGTNEDRTKVEAARKASAKDHLVFALPIPVIKQQNAAPTGSSVSARFKLDGNHLSVIASGLSSLHYPIDVDPSVVVTSSSDFGAGNDEDNNINFATSGQIGRAGATGGSAAGGWSSSTSFTTARSDIAVEAYNGYLYLLGGYDGTNYKNDVQYAAINSNGTLGSWSSTTSFTGVRSGLGAVAYNGYMYIMGGYDGTNYKNDVQYAPISSSGTIGTWTTTSSFTTVRAYFGPGVAYNNYLYMVSGWNDVSGGLTSVQYAPIKADGTVGTWAATTSLATGRLASAAAAYNGYVYVAGGWNGSYMNDVQYAPINSDGTLGSWTATSSFTTARYSFGFVPANGYIYLMGGSDGTAYSDVQYAVVYANGTLGPWKTTSSVTNARFALGAATYNGYLYVVGGWDGGTYDSDTQYAKIDSAGVTSSFTVSANTYTGNRNGVQVVANQGFLYVMGGYDSTSAPVNTIFAASIGADGTLGTFTSTGMTAFTTARSFFAAFAYNNFMYVAGGCTSAFSSCGSAANNVATLYKATISSSGTIGSWSAQTSFTTARFGLSAFAYNDYIYVLGGLNGSTFKNDIQYHLIGSSGAISGSWSTSAQTVPTARAYFGAVPYGGKLYIAGGCSAGALTCTTVRNDVQYASITTAGGDLSSAFTSTTAFTTARGQFGMTIVNGYMYIVGGWDGSTYYSTVQYAPINTNGTVGSWTNVTGSTLSTARGGIGLATYGGFMYVAGGFNGTTYYNDAQFAQVNNGGQGTVNSWTAGTVLTSAKFGVVSTAYNGYLYVMGGTSNGTTFTNAVQYAAISANGSIGSWSTANSFSTGREDFAGFAYNGYMYIFGGDNGSSSFNDSQYVVINSDGSLGTWSSTTSFTTVRADLAAVAYNGFAYVAGGNNSGTILDDVQYAAINSNGTLGSWTATSSMTTTRADFALLAYNGYMYALGGTNGGTTTFDEVDVSPINGNGTVTSWDHTTTFGTDRVAFGATIYDGYIYVYGGSPDTSATSLNDVQYAPINANGTLGNWHFTSTFTTARQYFGSASYNGYIYAVGGKNGSGSAITSVQYGILKSQPHIAHYSKLIDFSSNTATLQAIAYNGTLPFGIRAINYKTAGGDGIFGSLTNASSLSGTVSSCASGTVRWLWVDMTIDDSSTSTAFSDSLGTPANVTDFTVTYQAKHPLPSLRLRGGKFFRDQSLQSLDICGS